MRSLQDQYVLHRVLMSHHQTLTAASFHSLLDLLMYGIRMAMAMVV